MKLQIGWDKELNELERKIAKVDGKCDSIRAKMNAEIEKIQQSYLKKMPSTKELNDKKEAALKKIRELYVEHPQQKSKFKSYEDAAEVLAYYWQGEKLSSSQLLKKIVYNEKIEKKAFKFAELLTDPSSPERMYVYDAINFLHKDNIR